MNLDHYYHKLYKRDSSGIVREWYVQQSRDEDSYRVLSGILGGAIVTSEWTKCKPKNIGKANETSAQQQCAKEIAALYAKKLKEGYSKNVESIDEARDALVKPMLAKDYDDYKHKLQFPVYSQPKLDGIRCIANSKGLWTRTGERITTCQHIEAIVVPLCKAHGVTLDGELYNHELKDRFSLISSLVRRTKLTTEEKAGIEGMLQYHVFDLVDVSKPFSVRTLEVHDILRTPIGISDKVIPVLTERLYSMQCLGEAYERYASSGFEGQMVRLDAPYEQKRSKTLLKRKEFMDQEFEILGVNEGIGNRSGMAATVTCKAYVGDDFFGVPEFCEFRATLTGGVDYYRSIWKLYQENPEAIIGKQATVKFFQFSPDGIPRFPTVKKLWIDGAKV